MIRQQPDVGSSDSICQDGWGPGRLGGLTQSLHEVLDAARVGTGLEEIVAIKSTGRLHPSFFELAPRLLPWDKLPMPAVVTWAETARLCG